MSFNKLKMLLFSLLAISSLAISACSSSDDSKPSNPLEPVAPDDVAEYKVASCLYGYTDGGLAVTSPGMNVKVAHFGKKMDFNLLSPILSASGSEVVRFAEQTGVRYFKTTFYSSGACEFVASLPMAVGDIFSEFQKQEEKAKVLGLYLPQNSPNLPGTNSNAVIMVKRDSNKWVLVHEYLHHLYAIQSTADGQDPNSAKSNYSKASAELDSAKESLKGLAGEARKAQLKSVVVKFDEYAISVRDVLKEFFLEEMSIETILGEKMDSGELKYIHSKQRINGAAYIISSAKKVDSIIDAVKAEKSNIYYTNLMNLDPADSEMLDNAIEKLTSMSTEMATLKAKANNYLTSQNLTYKGLQLASLASQGSEPSVGCSHGEIPSEIMESIERRRHH